MLKSLTRKDVLEVAKLADACKAKNKPGFLHFPSAEADKMTKELLKGGSPERKRLFAKIESLTPKALEELEALMLFGRGDHAARLRNAWSTLDIIRARALWVTSGARAYRSGRICVTD